MKIQISGGGFLCKILLMVVGAAVFVLVPARMAAQQSAAPAEEKGASGVIPQAAAAGEKAAKDQFKNLKVLGDISANELFPAMRYITSALGVRCEYCHDTKNYASDDKAPKDRARGMMTMMFALDNNTFHGHRLVTCYTCHRGIAKAANIPSLEDLAATAAMASGTAAGSGAKSAGSNSAEGKSAAGTSGGTATSSAAAALPSAEEIIANYEQALGGAAAIEKITSRVDKGTLEQTSRNMSSAVEVYRKAPGKVLTIVHTPRGDMSQGLNGTIGWEQRGNRVEEQGGADLAETKRWAGLAAGLELKGSVSGAKVSGPEKVGDAEAYRVEVTGADGAGEQFYFDVKTGMLLRISMEIESPLGALPQNTDYSDYREVSGVKVPFMVRVVRVDGTAIYKWEQIQANVAIEDGRFEKPAEKPEEKAAEKH
jgi:photosynthetic reaction center cytochrome c subunit